MITGDDSFNSANTDVSGVSGVSGVSSVSCSPDITRQEEFQTYRVIEAEFSVGDRNIKPGLYFHGSDNDAGIWVSSPLYVEAVTCDENEENFGRQLRFMNTLGNWCYLAMPMEMLRGSSEELRGILLSMGLEIGTEAKARHYLARYLQEQRPGRRLLCALTVGWQGDSFVLPGRVIGPTQQSITFQSNDRVGGEYRTASTLQAWQTEIAALAVGNPLLILAISVAFSGPLLLKCAIEGGGVHFVGDSSTGKTTVLEAACSVWGGPDYRRSWRSTANGMEGAAALFNDTLLALDEISECYPKDVGAIIYSLANGRGKQRACKSGNARSVKRWRTLLLSTGELSIETVLKESGQRPMAGQIVRMLDIPVSRRFGAWDNLHGHQSGMSFSDSIKRSAAVHYGHAGIAFLESLTFDNRDHIRLLDRIKSLNHFDASLYGGEGQAQRAAAKFALIGYAGELATEYGITGWPEGASIEAAAEGFRLWLSDRAQGNDERNRIFTAVSEYIDSHGDSRFSEIKSNYTVINRSGWWRCDGENRIYLFTSQGLREALKGFNFNRSLMVLAESKALLSNSVDGKHSKSIRIQDRQVRLYEIMQKVLVSLL